MAETVIYLQVEPEWAPNLRAGEPKALAGMKVTKMLRSHPGRFSGVMVKLRLRIPDRAFAALATAVINVPETAVDYGPVVTVELPPARAHEQEAAS